MLDQVPVRRLNVDGDLTACLELAQSRDWSREENKWRLLFDIGRVYGVDDPASPGRLAGTVVSTPYGRDVTAISMVLVAERYERQGLGGRMMRHALDDSGAASACLTATEYGRPLYERLGFRALWTCLTHIGELSSVSREPASAGRVPSRGFEDGDAADVLALDRDVFGTSRAELFRRLPSFCEDFRVVRDPGDGTLLGFGGTWRSDDVLVIGPVTARDEDIALGLVDDLTADPPPGVTRVRLDTDPGRLGLVAWAERNGLKVTSCTTVMEYGEPPGGDPSRLFSPVMQALG